MKITSKQLKHIHRQLKDQSYNKPYAKIQLTLLNKKEVYFGNEIIPSEPMMVVLTCTKTAEPGINEWDIEFSV